MSREPAAEGPAEKLDTPSPMFAAASARDRVQSTPLLVSDRVAPRRRRPYDIIRFLLGGLTFGLFAWAASNTPAADLRVLELFEELPNWVRALAWFGFSAAGLFVLAVAAASVYSAGLGRGLARDLVAALAFVTLLALTTARVVQGEWPYLLPEFFAPEGFPPFPTLRASYVMTAVLVLNPFINLHMQRAMRWAFAASVISPFLLGLTTVTNLAGALSLSLAGVAAVRLAFGSPEGLPSLKRLGDTLNDVGVPVTDLRYLDEQPGTVGLASAVAADGRALDIKIYGIDAASRQQAERIWTGLWYRTAGPSPRAGRSEQAQHEALALLSARAAGLDVPEVRGAGQTPNGDVLLVTTQADGESLDESANLDDETLRRAWRDLRVLHQNARISHGRIAPDTVWILPDRAGFTDFAHASVFPTEQQLATDVVSMLATQASIVGATRALDALVDSMESEDLLVCMPYVQDAVLAPALRTRSKQADLKITSLQTGLAERLGTDPPELASIRRVQTKDVVIAVAAIIAANALITQISNVGVRSLLEAIGAASVGWFIVAFLLRMVGYTPGYIGLRAVISQPLPFLPTALLQSAKSFVGLVVPSMVGRVGMDIRFLQNLGVPLPVATTQGPVISLVGFVAEVLLLILCSWTIGQEIETEGLLDFDIGGLILLAIAAIAVGIAVILAVPKYRAKIVPAVRDGLASVRSVITSPRIMGAIFASETLERIISALTLGATVAAFGEHLSLAALVFVSVGTGLLAGIAPVPGGIGVAEATMTALLTLVGIPSSDAVTIALTHRMITSYLPPVLGFFSLRWLTKEGYL